MASKYTDYDFFLFFLDEENATWRIIDSDNEEEFTADWTMHTPQDEKRRRMHEYLQVKPEEILMEVNVPARGFLNNVDYQIEKQGRSHGYDRGNQHGAKARKEIPVLNSKLASDIELQTISKKFEELKSGSDKPHQRGTGFEELWRRTLSFYGWKPKKIQIHGEENDFTAIYQGNHILGEVRWHKTAMQANKMRDFLGKLDPRPQTIGFFISQSGFTQGAISVARRSINTKTVVMFGPDEISQVLTGRKDPGELFNNLLRDIYDKVLEE
ncbi:MAG: restriction endonuclease [Candidatus Saccharimonadales bacterium]